MGKLIVVVGNSGAGKTTLTQRLCCLGDFATGLEQHRERPFQRLFSLHYQRYALHNQVDYLLYRAEQEMAIRGDARDGIQDGGLDLDYYVFTRHFYNRGYLNVEEFGLCQRVYQLLRRLLPPPDLIIRLEAPLPVIQERFSRRGRTLEIAALEDLAAMQALLDEWLDHQTCSPVIHVDASREDAEYARRGEILVSEIRDLHEPGFSR